MMMRAPAFDLAQATVLPPQDGPDKAGSDHAMTGALDARWSALHHAGYAVRALARLSAQDDPGTDRFVDRFCQASPRRQEAIAVAIDDLSLVMHVGLTALVGVEDRGGDPVPAAETLWREFACARASLFAMLEPG